MPTVPCCTTCNSLRPRLCALADRDLPKPYSRNFTHPYNSFIDFTKYREFYAPGQISAAVQVDPSHTLYRPGDTVKIAATLKNPGRKLGAGPHFRRASWI